MISAENLIIKQCDAERLETAQQHTIHVQYNLTHSVGTISALGYWHQLEKGKRGTSKF